MTSRADAQHFSAEVASVDRLGDHLLRLTLVGDGLSGFASTGVPDEWVALTVPGQHQTRYYTVRSWDGTDLVLDVVVHERGLVTEWAQSGCVGQRVTLSAPRGSFAMPEDATWLLVVGDLTAVPAVARIARTVTRTRPDLPVTAYVEVPDGPMPDYVDADVDLRWVESPSGSSALEQVVRDIDWPEGRGYFWMAGESSQMRGIRKYLRHERALSPREYDVMGYWRAAVAGKRAPDRTAPVDPGPIYRAGRAAGKTDEQIWDEYDDAALRQDGPRD